MTQGGIGVSPDSINYITVGENLHLGKGYITDTTGREYTNAAPLYPITLAILNRLGMDPLEAARVVPVFSLALLVFPIFFIGKRLGSPLTGYLSSITCIVFEPILVVASYAWTEMPYILLSAFAILYLIKYSQKVDYKYLCIAGIFTSLACATRYAGLALLLTGLLIILIKNLPRIKTTLLHCLVYGFLSCTLVVPWLYRNMVLTGDLSGSSGFLVIDSGNLIVQLQTILNITLSNFLISIPQMLALWPVYGLGGITLTVVTYFACLIFLTRKGGWWTKFVKDKWTLVVYPFMYIGLIGIAASMWFEQSMSYRFLSVTYPFMILIAFSLVFHACSKIKSRMLLLVVGMLCGLLLISYSANALTFCEGASIGQQYAHPRWEESPLIHQIELAVDKDTPLYSDMADAVTFKLDRAVSYPPDSRYPERVEDFFSILDTSKTEIAVAYFGEFGTRPEYITQEMGERLDSLCSSRIVTKEGGILWIIEP